MKGYIISCILLIMSSMMAIAQGNGFITLKGRQFYDGNGDPFYPLLMNYGVELDFSLGWTITSGTYMLSSHWQNGPNHNGYDCTDITTCNQQIIDELNKIHSWGFNMIRPDFTPEWNSAEQKFILKGDEQDAPGHSLGHHVTFTEGIPGSSVTSNDYTNDPNVQKYFSYLDWIANAAHQLGMYTMINGGLKDISEPGAKPEYLAFLDALGRHFKNNPNIAYYDILNEPKDHYLFANHGWDYNNFTKQQACELIANYYNALKAADPNHLITGGNFGDKETFLFDIGLLKLDFSQPQFYSYELLLYDNYSVANKIDRVKGMAYWVSKTCPMPWMTGETGFRATDNPDFPPGPQTTDYLHTTSIDGTNSDEVTYVDAILAATRDYIGSGFNWWYYQEAAWPSTDPWSDPLFSWGLLLLNADVNNPQPGDVKPAAQSFQNYLDGSGQPPAINSSNSIEPPHYRDPFLNGEPQYNGSHVNAITGTILDQDNQPIENAYIEAKNWLYTDGSILPHDIRDSWTYTFSKDDGSFELIPYNYDPDNIGDNRIVWLSGSAVGAEIFKRGPNTDQQMQNVGTINLKRIINFKYDAIVSESVGVSDTKNFKGWNSVTISNSTIDGTSDIRARQMIDVNSEFHASTGSEVHIFTEETFSDCSNDYTGFIAERNNNSHSSSSSYESNLAREIEVQFHKLKSNELIVSIFPNPSNGFFTIALNTEKSNEFCFIKINNMLGKSIREFSFSGNETVIDASTFSKGVYFVEVNTNNKIVTKKLIIN